MSGGSVKRDPVTGRWFFVVDVPGTDGRRRQMRRRGFDTKKAASEALVELRASLQQGTFVRPAKLTLRAYLEGWVESLPLQGRRHSTVESYRLLLGRYIFPTLGHVELQQLTALDLDALYARMSEPQASGRTLSKRTIRLAHSVVGKALSDAERKGLVRRNVARLASPPSAKSTKAREMSVWTPAELRKFLDGIAGSEHATMLRTAAMTGVRRGELCGLRWSAIDVDAGRLTVSRALLSVRGRLVESEPKTERGHRVIDLDAVTCAALRDHRRRQVEERLLMGAGYRDGGFVFALPDGAPWMPDRISRTFDLCVTRSGLPRIRFHDLRHTHVTHLLAAGANPRIVSERLGHASVSFTLDRYGHVLPGQQANAAAAVAALVDEAR